MWAAIIAAPETLFRLTFLDLGREHRKLLFQLPAAAVGALPLAFIACVFQQFGYLAAVIAFIFVNRHNLPREIILNSLLCYPRKTLSHGVNLVSTVIVVLKRIYVMIMRGNNQYQSRLRRNV
jgi:hypothetical protein